MLAGLSGLIGLPAVLLLMPRQIGNRPVKTLRTGLPHDWSFLRVRDFWLLALANMNPERKARKKIFLSESDKKAERKDLAKKMELWVDMLSASNDMGEMIFGNR